MVVEVGAHDRARVVRRYLSALDTQKVGRSVAKTAESLLHRIHQIDTDLLSADPVRKLHLTQERIDLHAEHLRLTTGSEEAAELEKAFVRVARGYGDRHGISFSAWRQIGVDADVLASAGIRPAQKTRPTNNGAAPAVVEAPNTEASVASVVEAAPVAKKAPAKKATAAKKAPAAAKKATATATKTGATRSVKKAAAATPEQTNLLS